MKLIIDEKYCQKYSVSLSEILTLLTFKYGVDSNLIQDMLREELIVGGTDREFYQITKKGEELISKILNYSAGNIDNETRLDELATQLQQCFPKQKMKDRFGREVPYYYRCNKAEIKNKLKKFFSRYGEVSDEDILDATRRYVDTYKKNNYTGMRLAKYFIWKDDKQLQDDGETRVEALSDLATFLENKGSDEDGETNIADDWMLTVK